MVLGKDNDSTNIKMALFDLGNIYWNIKKDNEKAKQYYDELIRRYPFDILSNIVKNTMGEGKKEENKNSRDSTSTNITANYDFELQNYPNPFNPSTTIVFNLLSPGFIKITVFDILGKEVKTLVNEYRGAGRHKVLFDASNLAGGVYYYKLTADRTEIIKKLIYMK